MAQTQPKLAINNDGFIIVAVLWILVALATLVGAFSVYVASEVAPSQFGLDRLRAESLLYAGIELTAYRLIGLDDASRPSSGAFSFRLGRASAAVEFQSEGARIDLNYASADLLSGLFATLGTDKDAADFAAARIVGWRTGNPLPNQNQEADRYRTAGLNYAPRQAPFQNVAELHFVLGLPPNLLERAIPFVTVFNGHAEIDVNEAAPEVIESLPHMTPDLAAAILKQRDPRNPQAVLQLASAASGVTSGGRRAIRATIHGALDDGRKIKAEVVFLVADNSPNPYRILAWKDDFDGAF